MGLVGLVGHDPGCSICRTPLYPDISPNREWVAPRQCWMINRSARANIHTIDVSTKNSRALVSSTNQQQDLNFDVVPSRASYVTAPLRGGQ